MTNPELKALLGRSARLANYLDFAALNVAMSGKLLSDIRNVKTLASYVVAYVRLSGLPVAVSTPDIQGNTFTLALRPIGSSLVAVATMTLGVDIGADAGVVHAHLIDTNGTERVAAPVDPATDLLTAVTTTLTELTGVDAEFWRSNGCWWQNRKDAELGLRNLRKFDENLNKAEISNHILRYVRNTLAIERARIESQILKVGTTIPALLNDIY